MRLDSMSELRQLQNRRVRGFNDRFDPQLPPNISQREQHEPERARRIVSGPEFP